MSTVLLMTGQFHRDGLRVNIKHTTSFSDAIQDIDVVLDHAIGDLL